MVAPKKVIAKKVRATKKAPATDAPRNKGGRPTIFDAKMADELLNAARAGTPLQVACNYAGIHPETLRLWRRRGEAALLVEPGRRSPIERKFAEFIVALDKAMAQAGVRAQLTVHSLMVQDVKSLTPEQQRIAMSAAQFFLTHRLSDYYNTKTTSELTGKNGKPIEMALSAEQAWEIVQAINNGKPIEVDDADEA